MARTTIPGPLNNAQEFNTGDATERGISPKGLVDLVNAMFQEVYGSNPTLQSTGLLKFRAARALGTRRTRVVTVGDSLTRGVLTGGGTAQATGAYPMQLANLLQAQGIPAGANNVWGDGGSWNLAQTIANFLTGDSRVSVTGAWALGATKSAGGNAFTCSAAGSMTFTPVGNVTKFDIYWRDGAAGRNFNWQVDGGVTTQINSSGTTQMQKTTVSAGAAGIHALTLNWVAGAITIVGIDAYDDSNSRQEIAIQNWGISGATSPVLLDNTDSAAGRQAMFAFYQPDLTIIEPFVNNWRQSISLLQTTADLLQLVQLAQNWGSAAIMTPPYDAGTSGNAAIQDQYAALAAAVCAQTGAALIDHRGSLVSYNAANLAGFYSDTVHFSFAGYGDCARFVRSSIF